MRTRHYRLQNPCGETARVAEPSPQDSLEPARRVLTVSELTRQVQFLLEQNFSSIWVDGEVSEVTYHTSGHLYFTLKDAQSVLKCVAWREALTRIKFTLEPGMQVLCFGGITTYARKGSIYQLRIEKIEPKGMGALQLAFEQLKEKLQKEGLFAEERKRPLPVFPERIGIVTSPQGAAIDDILRILRGQVEVVLRPTRVQGDGASPAIAQGIRDLNRLEGLDLLIVGRGGGSLEDLWAFNEEIVARAIVESALPIISAVGHEKDWTISDYVADLRAPTPTKGAEMVLARRRACFDRLSAVFDEPAFAEPEEWLGELAEKVEDLELEMAEGLKQPLFSAAHQLKVLQGDLLACSPQAFLLHQSERLHGLQGTLFARVLHLLEQSADQTRGLAGRLNALSPLAVLERGYSITFDEQGRIVKKALQVEPGDRIETRLHEGKILSRVEKANGV